MKKKYVFNNYWNKKKGISYIQVEVEAETILEAKKKVKEMGYENMIFSRIKVLGYG